MPCYVGLDVSKHKTNVCVIDEDGVVLKHGVVESDPKAISGFLRGERRRYRRVGLEAGSLAMMLYPGLAKAGLPVVCIEAWHASRVLEAARTNKTDRNDAQGIAEMMRAAIFKAVYVKTIESQQIRATLTARSAAKSKSIDIQRCITGILLAFGLKEKSGTGPTFDRRVREVIGTNVFLLETLEPLLVARVKLREAADELGSRLRRQADADPICSRLMTAPGVGPLVAITYRAAIDVPSRFRRSRDVAAHLGLTPLTKQTAGRDRHGRISCCGDGATRSALYLAAHSQLRAVTKASPLKTWGEAIQARRGKKKAIIAVARRLAVILHQMWVTETDFRWSAEPA